LWQAEIDRLTDKEAEEIQHDWLFGAREEQRPPEGDWRVWLYLAGRGAGKTRSGAEWVRAQVALGRRRIALVAPTAADARDVIVEGETFWLRVEPYVDCDWRANVQRSQAPRKIFERGALWQYKEQRAICEKRSDAAWVWLFMDASHGVPPVLRR